MPYQLSAAEAQLYEAVTEYVRQEFNRADALANAQRAGTVGFALTILQRRLASSPEAIYQSLRRRRARLEDRRSAPAQSPELAAEDIEDLDDAPEPEVEAAEARILDQATAAGSSAELQAEIETLKRLESRALDVRRRSEDAKWRELASLLGEVFTASGVAGRIGEPTAHYGRGEIPRPTPSPRQKLVLFTEHRDTLHYLQDRIITLLGREEAVVVIHGGLDRAARHEAQEAFRHDPAVQVLLATDAAGEGINLQQAHLMVNYDLPWNPNRLEQRFGRIHRIGQTEVCHLWNLVANQTREGDVYQRLLEKLERARQALGGQVFDVLGKLEFEGRPLRDLLLQAIRYGEQPAVRTRLDTAVDQALDQRAVQDLLAERQLVHDAMDASRLQRVRQDMERAEARRLQPHYIEAFFLEAFQRLGGAARQREPRRYEVTQVPALVRNQSRPVLPRYERIAFDKSLIAPPGQPAAAFVCPGHALLDAVLDRTLEHHRDLLKRGAALVDERDPGQTPRVLFYLEHALQDASRVVSKQMLYIEINATGNARCLQYAPYLDHRPLAPDEPSVEAILERPECAWVNQAVEQQAQAYAVACGVPEHLAQVREPKRALIAKTEAAVKDRLTKEISYWDHRAEQLKLQEQAGAHGARLNSDEARKRADALQARLHKRLQELQLEAQISPLPPVVLGGLLVVPQGLVDAMMGRRSPVDTQASAARARAVVMEVERGLGYAPTDREFEKLGYDIESRVPGTGRLRFIEVKGRVHGAATITVTKNEILYSLNKPDDSILAIVEFLDDDRHRVRYLRRPFQREPDFGVTSVNYDFAELLARAEDPT